MGRFDLTAGEWAVIEHQCARLAIDRVDRFAVYDLFRAFKITVIQKLPVAASIMLTG
ncbi:MAG: hypothetical protein AAFW83_12695 [Pseudomonadota bacterium]